MYLPSHHHLYACAPMINIQSTLRTAPDFCKNVSLIVFGSNGNSFTVSTCANMCVCVSVYIYVYIYSSKCRNAGHGKEITETGTAMNSTCQENLSACTHAIGLPVLL